MRMSNPWTCVFNIPLGYQVQSNIPRCWYGVFYFHPKWIVYLHTLCTSFSRHLISMSTETILYLKAPMCPFSGVCSHTVWRALVLWMIHDGVDFQGRRSLGLVFFPRTIWEGGWLLLWATMTLPDSLLVEAYGTFVLFLLLDNLAAWNQAGWVTPVQNGLFHLTSCSSEVSGRSVSSSPSLSNAAVYWALWKIKHGAKWLKYLARYPSFISSITGC